MFHTIKQGTLEYLTADALEGSVHCFSTRLGGVSEGQLSSLNLGTHRGKKYKKCCRDKDLAAEQGKQA